MSRRAELEVLPDEERLAAAAAARFLAAGNTAINTHGRFIVALSGGSTPRNMYARLGSQPLASRLDWSRVHILWGDERCVPPDHASSNYRMVRESLLDHVPVPPSNVHRIRGEDEPADAAARYESLLRALLRTPVGPPPITTECRLDLVLLGLGSDGHTASLFPGGASLQANARWVTAEYAPAVPVPRVTLTPIVINAAAEVVFLVSGRAKSAIVQKVLQGPERPNELPAQLIAPSAGRLLWLVDAPAASELQRTARR